MEVLGHVLFISLGETVGTSEVEPPFWRNNKCTLKYRHMNLYGKEA